MSEILILGLAAGSLMVGAILGYFARQSIARRQANTLEAELQKKINKTREEAQSIILAAKQKATQALERIEQEEARRREEFSRTERFLRKKEDSLEEKDKLLFKREQELRQRIEELKETKEIIENLREEAEKQLEKTAALSQEEAKKEIFKNLEKTAQSEILERMRKLEAEGDERYQARAKEILVQTIERCALSQAQEVTTSTVSLPNEEIKGRIIGKEGRNIRTLEKLTGTEVIVDDTPEIVVISGFNPLRRQIAKIALEKLIRDGRIQPSRIEDEVERAKEEIASEIKKAGEQAVFETEVLGLDPKLIQVLGRLNFRSSYGQNVLLHSIEVAHLASALAAEVGADVEVCKRAGLLHDIGKALDYQVEGSHVDIGVKVLEKFGEAQEVIKAMRSHHEEYQAETLEAVIVKVADQISGARPGARKESLDEYLKRLENLEKVALEFSGIQAAYAIQAGRELRVFVRPEEIDDLRAHQMAKEIAKRIQEELKYPGEIKITLIREKRIVEYAR